MTKERKYRQPVMSRARRESADLVEAEGENGTHQRPDGTRATLHRPRSKDTNTPVLHTHGTGFAFELADEVRCTVHADCVPGTEGSRNHVARYDSVENRVVKLALHEYPRCARKSSDETVGNDTETLVRSVADRVTDETHLHESRFAH